MSRILITIETGEQRLDAAVPSHLTAVDLLAWIERTMGPSCDDTPRSLVMPDGSAIDDGTCLASAGALDGMTLRAVSLGTAPHPPEARPREMGIPDLPAALSVPERLLATARALLGLTHPTGVNGPWTRAVSAWQWTDHDRRLRWLIARPTPPRASVVSVSGHRSAEVGEQLALAFASTRPEPVVLVDGDPAGRLSRHLGGSRVSWVSLARDLADPALGRLQRDRLFARSPAGLPMIPAAEVGVDHHIDAILESLSQHGAIVVFDEGPTPETPPVGDDAVISTIGAFTPPTGAIIAEWGSQALAGTDGRSPHVPMDGGPHRMLELAATVAGRWAMSGPNRSDHGELG